MTATVRPGLERRLKAELAGEVRFDRFSRGRYATDALAWPVMMPVGVVLPRTVAEAERAIALAAPRGGGVTVLGRAAARAPRNPARPAEPIAGHRLLEIISIMWSSSMSPTPAAWSSLASCSMSSTGGSSPTAFGFRSTSRPPRAPPSGAWWATIPAAPAHCATAIRARTCSRSTRCWPTAARSAFPRAEHARDLSNIPPSSPLHPLARHLLALAAAQAEEIEAKFPQVQRRVGGYNLDALVPGRNDLNLAHILVGLGRHRSPSRRRSRKPRSWRR